MGNNLQILLCLADLESPGAGRGVAMNVRPLFAGLGVAAGGAAAIFSVEKSNQTRGRGGKDDIHRRGS